ncbi:MAG: leucine-rich repeat domain-containing protein [Paludibacteraceae bacterium]|nr:leucine-rich repeat domain-containing protein [Paludibacteraceae bacterium]
MKKYYLFSILFAIVLNVGAVPTNHSTRIANQLSTLRGQIRRTPMANNVVTILPSTPILTAGSYEFTSNGIQVSCTNGHIYAANDSTLADFRCYANASITFSSTQKIVSLVVNGFAKKNLSVTATSGDIFCKSSTQQDVVDDEVLSITNINASSITINCSAQLRFYSVTITLETSTTPQTIDIENLFLGEALWDNGYWNFVFYSLTADLELAYPMVSFEAKEFASSESSINGEWSLYSSQYWKNGTDQVVEADISKEGSLTISCVGENLYEVVGSFIGLDGNTYQWQYPNEDYPTTCMLIYAFDIHNDYSEITLSDCKETIDTLNVAEAVNMIQSQNPAMKEPHDAKDVVSQAPYSAYWPGYATIWLSDIDNPSLQMEGYKIYKDANKTKWQSAAEIPCAVNDTVILYADALGYYAEQQIYETTSGYLSKVFPCNYKDCDMATCKELWNLAISGETGIRQISGVVTYVNSKQFFYQDITGGMQVYSANHNLSEGDVFSAYGTIAMAGSAPEVRNLMNIKVGTTQTPQPTDISLHDIANYPYQLVHLVGLKLYNKDEETLFFCQDGDSIQYNHRNLNLQDFEVNAYYDAIVVINSYNGYVLNGHPENITLNTTLTHHHTFSVSSSDPAKGIVSGENGTYLEGTQLVIQAIPQGDYAFLKWSDGNLETMRTITLTQDTVLIAEFGYHTSGQCGDNLFWSLKNDTLFFSGSGAMNDFDFVKIQCPWSRWNKQIYAIILPEGITSIGENAFYGCDKVSELTIPTTLVKVGDGAFKGVNSLTNVYVSDLAAWCQIDFEDSPMWSENQMHLYVNDQEIVDLVIPNGVTTISGGTFAYCKSIKTVIIPASVSTIKEAAFLGCTNIRTITCYATIVPTTDDNVFLGLSQYAKAYVWEALLEDYQFTPSWSTLQLYSIEKMPTNTPNVFDKFSVKTNKKIINGHFFIQHDNYLIGIDGTLLK